MRSSEAPVVVICGDVGTGPVPLRLGELAAQLRRELSGAAPLLCPPVCEARDVLVEALAVASAEACRRRVPGVVDTTR